MQEMGANNKKPLTFNCQRANQESCRFKHGDVSVSAAKELGKLIRDKRKQKNMTQAQLATTAGQGLFRQAIGEIENGRLPNLLQLIAIAKVLEIRTDEWVALIKRELGI